MKLATEICNLAGSILWLVLGLGTGVFILRTWRRDRASEARFKATMEEMDRRFREQVESMPGVIQLRGSAKPKPPS